MKFFTSDTHFGHGRIIGYSNRPWWRPAQSQELHKSHHLAKVARKASGEWIVPDVAAMEAALVYRWNGKVGKEDTVYHLGDFAWWHLDPHDILRIREQLNGNIILIVGDHDRAENKARSGPAAAAVREAFPTHCDFLELSHDKWKIGVTHVGPHSMSGAERTQLSHNLGEVDVLLHGHSHGNGDTLRWWAARRGMSIPTVDMSVENWNYAPVSFEEIMLAALDGQG